MFNSTKKFISLILAVVLVVSVLTVGAFALEDGKTVAIHLEADKDLTKLSAGDEVTFSMYYELADFDQLYGVAKLLFLYDSAAYTTAGYTLEGDFAEYYKDGSPSSINNTQTAWTSAKGLAANTTSDLSAVDTAFVVPLAADTSKDWDGDGIGNTAAAGFLMADDGTGRTAVELTFTFTVVDPTANMDVFVCDAFGTSYSTQYIKTTTGTKATNLDRAAVDVTLASAMANNVADAGPKVDYYKAQIKMTPDSATTVKDDFQFRVQSVITDADWDAFFSQTATADESANAITEMGIVAYKGAGTFDEATAKALVTDGTAADDYATAGTTYVQKASDAADAYFGAIIKAKHSTMPNDVTYMGYVKYVDAAGAAQVIFYETAKTAALASNYDNFVSAYLAANPYQG